LLPISRLSGKDLFLPPIAIALGTCEMNRAAMPKAAIHKNANALARKDNVGSTTERSNWAVVLAEPEPIL